MVQQFRTACQTCEGQGRVLPFEFVCKACQGNRIQQESTSLEVNIPAGSHDGQRFVMRGEGDCPPGHTAGDVVFLLQVSDHPQFERRSNDLVSRARITLTEALCGCSVEVKHLDGRLLRLKSKPGQVVKPDCWRCVAGEGMPVFGDSTTRGHLFVHFEVIFPDTLDNTTAERLAEAVRPGNTGDAGMLKVGWIERLLQPLRRWALPVAEETTETADKSARGKATEYFLQPVEGPDDHSHRRGPRSRL